jgi:uncharacterized cupin superfamily protein
VARPNLYEGEFTLRVPQTGTSGRRLGPDAGMRELGATVYELAPGATGMRLHAHYGNEELFVVLEGTPTLRTHEGEEQLRRGDVVACVRGREGTHTIENRSEQPALVLAVSTANTPDVVMYPEEDMVGVATRHPFDPVAENGDPGVVGMFRAGDNQRR